MRTVHVRIRHNDHTVVSELLRNVVLPDPRPQCSDHETNFLGREHLVQAGLFDIEDLPLEGKYSLIPSVSSLFGRASGGIPLHKKQFT